jgi:two-component system cell cycle sensor histidine kinase/response regulator CckA
MNGKYKILIVDDNMETVAGLKSYLDEKYNIVSGYDGLEGIQIFKNDKDGIDLVITDLVMPSISGVALIELIKKINPAIPIIAITGWGHHPKALASEAKADLVLDKPFEMQELDKALEKLFSETHEKSQKFEGIQKP